MMQNIAILPNGDIISGDALDDADNHFLYLMKTRDIAKTKEESDYYQRIIWRLYENHKDTIIEVNREYDY